MVMPECFCITTRKSATLWLYGTKWWPLRSTTPCCCSATGCNASSQIMGKPLCTAQYFYFQGLLEWSKYLTVICVISLSWKCTNGYVLNNKPVNSQTKLKQYKIHESKFKRLTSKHTGGRKIPKLRGLKVQSSTWNTTDREIQNRNRKLMATTERINWQRVAEEHKFK